MVEPTAKSFLDEAVGMLHELGMGSDDDVAADRRARAVVCVLGAIALELKATNDKLDVLLRRNNFMMRQ